MYTILNWQIDVHLLYNHVTIFPQMLGVLPIGFTADDAWCSQRQVSRGHHDEVSSHPMQVQSL